MSTHHETSAEKETRKEERADHPHDAKPADKETRKEDAGETKAEEPAQ